MALKKGKCRNEECEFKGKVVEKEETDFFCECGQPLFPYKESNVPFLQKHGKLLLPLLALLVIGVGAGLFFLLSDDEEMVAAIEQTEEAAKEEIKEDSVKAEEAAVTAVAVLMSNHEITMKTGESRELSVAVAGAENAVPVWSSSASDVTEVSSDGKVRAMSEGNAWVFVSVSSARDSCKVTVEAATEVVEQAEVEEKPVETAPSPSNSVITLSYGRYTGDIKGGYPEGMGRLVYTKSRVINKYDMKERIAEKGDYVTGEFVRGFLVNGRLYSSSGQLKETLMIGVPTDGVYEQK